MSVTKIGSFDIHPLADMVPMAGPLEQQALQDDIEREGQREMIVLYRGKVVDGRCRIKACIALGLVVIFRSLAQNMTLNEVEAYVTSLNIRRNLTVTQKALIAYRLKQVSSATTKSILIKWGLTENSYYAAKIVSELNPTYATRLYNGGTVEIEDKKRSRSIRTVANYLTKITNAIIAEPEPSFYSPKEVKSPLGEVFTLLPEHFTGN